MSEGGRALTDTPAFERSRHRRKKVEMLFAHLKRFLRLGRFGCADRPALATSSCSRTRAAIFQSTPRR